MKGKPRGAVGSQKPDAAPWMPNSVEGLAERDSPTAGEPATKAPVMCSPPGPKKLLIISYANSFRGTYMTPRPLLLVGAGGLAREVLAAVRLQPSEWKPIGALDDDPSKHGADLDGVPVLGGSEVAGELTDAAVVVCMAHARRPTGRLCFARRLALPDDRWATIVHPAASVPEGSVLGPGTVLLAGVVITTPLRIGAHVVAMPHVLITHDDKISDGGPSPVGSRSAGPSQSASARTSDRAH